MAGRKVKAIEACAYLRTSSKANVDGDSPERQRDKIAAYAKRAGFKLVAEFYDAAVSGSDAIEDRPGFAALLDRIENNGVRVIIVEDVSRFARELQAHVLGIALLRQRGVKLLTADGSDLTDGADEMQEAMLRIMAIFAEVEKKRLVRKLKAARDRVREATGKKCGGPPSLVELYPEAAALAHQLRRKPRGGKRLSLRAIADRLAEAGHVDARGEPFHPSRVATMIEARP